MENWLEPNDALARAKLMVVFFKDCMCDSTLFGAVRIVFFVKF